MLRYWANTLLLMACAAMLVSVPAALAALSANLQAGQSAMVGPCGAMDMSSDAPTGDPARAGCAIGCMVLAVPSRLPGQKSDPIAIEPCSRHILPLRSLTSAPDTPPPRSHFPSLYNQSNGE